MEHAANIEMEDRRHVYLPVSDHKIGDTKYFTELVMEIENGGREAFLKFMLDYKSEIDLTVMPGGQGEQREKDERRSAPASNKFILDLYEHGTEQYDDIGGRNYSETDFKDWDGEDIVISKFLLLDMFHIYCRKSNIKAMHMDMQALFGELSSAGYYANRKKSAAIKYAARMTEVGQDRKLRMKCRLNYMEKDYESC